jgi:hypothetical protein
MGYKELCARNPGMRIYQTDDSKLLEYGKVWTGYNLDDVFKWAENFQIPEHGNTYQASDPDLESIPVTQKIISDIYGGSLAQAGPCCGHNQVLNGIEYHIGSEVTIAIKPCVLFLGKLHDMVHDTYEGNLSEAFYIESGQIVQTYETTLHYTPCKVEDYFFTVCILPRGTGTPLPGGRRGILKSQNKWFIAHPDNTPKVTTGDFPGLLGEMRKIV